MPSSYNCKSFKCALKLLPGFNTLKSSKLPLRHGNLPRSVSSVNFSFERTNLSRNAFGLRKETRGGLGKTAFRIGDFCEC